MGACQFSWAKLVFGDDGLVFQIKCTICNKIKGKLKTLAPKLHMFQKHVGHWKALVLSPSMVNGDFYYGQDVVHCKNEWFFIRWNSKSIITLVHLGIHLGVWKKFIQFVIVLHIFLHGWPMLKYESWREFFLLLKGQKHPIETLVKQ
jgi:hypothetical protein